MPRGAAEDQLNNYKGTPTSITNSSGRPVGTRDASLTVGTKGPILLQDHQLIDELAHFDRERIPERVVHAKGAGAFGYFEVTHDITKYCAAKVFEKVGKRTKIAVRFSTVGGENGSADTVRDPRGFAVKFYTDDGIWDLVGNNTPIFFIRDPILFSSFIHTQKRNPATHLKDPDMFWDFISLRPETTHQVMFLFADRGIPDGYRFMNGYGSHTFKTVNKDGKAVYVKFHYKSNQGIKNLEVSKADHLSGADPDYSIRDLYNAIAKGDYPQYNMSIQVMTFDEAEKFKYNPFDLTKIWPHNEFPLIPVGKLVLNRNPSNYFAEVEQIAFAPSHMVPGIEPSPDKMLQGRLFSYNDTHRHRLGANYLHLPVNCPYRVTPSLGVLTKPGDVEVEVPAGCTKNFQRDGPQSFVHEGGAPNYFPNSFGGPTDCERAKNLEVPFRVTGDVCRYSSGDSEDNFGQPRDFWQNVLDEAARKRLVSNIAGHLKNASGFIQERTVKNFAQVDVDFGRQLTEALKLAKSANL